jgi:hypothetical protein
MKGSLDEYDTCLKGHSNLVSDVDFEPIGMVSAIPALIVARKDFPPRAAGAGVTAGKGKPFA